MASGRALERAAEKRQEHLLWVLSDATFPIFFQAYMVAALIPRLAARRHLSVPLQDRLTPGRGKVTTVVPCPSFCS